MVHLSHLYMTTGKTIALSIWTFVSKVISMLFNMLSRFVIAFGCDRDLEGLMLLSVEKAGQGRILSTLVLGQRE